MSPRTKTKAFVNGGAGLSPRRAGSAADIERGILLKIARKEYSPGQQIPTCEALSAELGVNKNTVSKAYRSLAQQGYLLTRAGFGTFITKRPVRISQDRALDKITDLLTLAVQEAKLCGLQHRQFREFAEDVAARAYLQEGPRIGFVECNRHDATTLSRDLQAALSYPIEPLLLNDVLRAPKRIAASYDILAVGMAHLAGVEAVFSPSTTGAITIAGINIPIDPESLLRVARLRAGTQAGVICELEPTLSSLTGMISACNPRLVISRCLASNNVAMRRLAKSSDVLIVTPSVAEHVKLNDSQCPIVVVAFRPDAHSIESLSMLLTERMPLALAGPRSTRAPIPPGARASTS